MKKIDLKKRSLVNLTGSIALGDSGFSRFLKEDIESLQTINKDISYLSRNSAGINARFVTNSNKIVIKVKLETKANMNHMSALGQAGFDLYMYNEKLGEYVFHKSGIFDRLLEAYEVELVNFTDNKERKYILNFPLYSTVEELEFYIDDYSTIIPHYHGNDKKIVMYGTSIVQGGCVSRPGMLYSNIISRWLDSEIYNYGFSGQAFLEKEVATMISKVENPNLLIIDAQPNAGIDFRLRDNLDLFVKEYRKHHPTIPILICSRISYALDYYNDEVINRNIFYRKWLRNYVSESSKNDNNIYFIDGKKIFKGNFSEFTIDGIHPNDLGSMELAKFYFKQINKYINK